MIIKSLSRKKPSFISLIQYIDNGSIKDNGSLTIWRNLYSTSKDEIIEEFEENSKNLKSLKNWNYLYHEIISLDPKQTKDMPRKEQIKALSDIWDKYLSLRAKNNLSYWKIHLDKEHIHLHICISANEIYSNKRFRLSKWDFNKIRKDVENYKNIHYPQLETKIYDNEIDINHPTLSNNEQELKNRTKKPTLREQFRAKLEKILDSAINYKELIRSLKSAKIEIIKRWNTVTAKDLTDGKKYRLKILWLVQKVQDTKERIKNIKDRKKEIESFKKEQAEPIQTNTYKMNSIQAKKIQIVDLLETLSIKPNKIKGDDIWYLSPFRDETTPSFKIDSVNNIWYDHWMGKWWNILDFCMVYNNSSFKEALEFIANCMQPNLLNQQIKLPQKQSIQPKLKETQEKPNKLSITKTKPLENMALIEYLKDRAINTTIAKRYINETYYKIWDKNYFWVSFKNNSDGVELNNKYFKWIVWEKDITTLDNSSSKLIVFEGMMDFLAYASVSADIESKNILVLNSVSMINKAVEYINSSNYTHIETYLDNDKAWIDATALLKEQLWDKITSKEIIFKIKSNIYKKHKDFNDYIIARRDKKLKDLELQKSDRILERVRQRDKI